VIIRNPRIDIGFKVESSLGYWRLNQAKIVA
jgi:hypothetical protein